MKVENMLYKNLRKNVTNSEYLKKCDTIIDEHISKRLDELIEITGLSLDGIGKLCNIGITYLKAIYYKRSPISLRWVNRIAKVFEIDLVLFCTFEISLSSKIKEAENVKLFYQKFKDQAQYFASVKPAQRPSKEEKTESKFIANLVESDFFDQPRFTSDVVDKLLADTGLRFTSDWAFHELIPYINNKILNTEKRHKKKKSGGVTDKKYNVYFKPETKG